MSTALFINGIYEVVLNEIVEAQDIRGGGDSYLQPYKGQVISMLRKLQPSPSDPIRLYVSTTANLSQICYTGLIVGWEDKRKLSQRRRGVVRKELEEFQPGEVNLFNAVEEVGGKAVNLLTIRNLQRLNTFHTTALLRKVSDDLPLKKRSRSGGWSEVYDLGDLLDLPSDTQERFDEELSVAIGRSSSLSESALRDRLASAAKTPEKIQIISMGYRRNADVIVAVLRRADGVCERCGRQAPFLRRKDDSPYLEVHHWTPLSQGGEDSIENAAALCPNCHREVHHGKINSEQGGAGQPPTRPESK